MSDPQQGSPRDLVFSPFCCASIIPSYFRYLIDLLPPSTGHSAFSKPPAAAPFLASFLAYTLVPTEPHIRSRDNTYYAMVQVNLLTSQSPAPEDHISLGSPKIKHHDRDTSDTSTDFEVIESPNKLTDPSAKNFYSAVERVDEKTNLDEGCKVKGKVWRVVDEHEANRKIKGVETDTWDPKSKSIIMAGKWIKLADKERLYCESHKLLFEVVVWVRD